MLIKEKLREALERLKELYGQKLVAVALYGSWARGEAHEDSDIDLLILLRNLSPKRLERIPEIIKIRKTLGIWNLEPLLITPEECQRNLINHHPFYLDIVYDAHVLYDAHNFLSEALAKTRQEIEAKGIKRIPDGWAYPVKYREATFLSPLNNQHWAQEWLEDAKRDLRTAQILKQEQLYDRCVYHCQQAVEKAVKAILICFGKFKKSHWVGELLGGELKNYSLSEWAERLKTLADYSIDLEPHSFLARYPSEHEGSLWIPAEQYNITQAQKALSQAQAALDIASDFIKWWFEKQEL